MNLRPTFFEGEDGTEIFYLVDIPKNAEAIIIIAHGYMEHSGRYVDFANQLVQNNYGVCILDHRGNGHSGGERGDVQDFFLFVSDIKFLINKLKKYNMPIITYGHSMGGLITFLYGLKYPKDVQAQVFSSPALGQPPLCEHIPKVIYQKIGAGLPLLKIKRLGINVAVKDKLCRDQFRHDTLCNSYSTVRFFDQFLRCGIDYVSNNAYKYEKPSLFLLADTDYVIPIEQNIKVLKKISNLTKTVKVYKNCMHDLLHDEAKNVQAVSKDVLSWLSDTLESTNKCAY